MIVVIVRICVCTVFYLVTVFEMPKAGEGEGRAAPTASGSASMRPFKAPRQGPGAAHGHATVVSATVGVSQMQM